MIRPKTVKAPVEFTPKVAKQIRARAGGCCEGCGQFAETQLHHRLFKSRGGRGTVPNGLALCGVGNASGCHGDAHTGSGESLGWAVPSYADPAYWPARRAFRGDHGVVTFGFVLYADDGTFREITAERATEITDGKVA